jgi:hypothetical protein
MKTLFFILNLLSITTFAAEPQNINKNNDLKKDNQKIAEERCSQYAIQSKVPQKRLSVFMAECMASLSLGNIDEGEEMPVPEKSDAIKKSK